MAEVETRETSAEGTEEVTFPTQYVRVRDRATTIQLKDGPSSVAAKIGSVWCTDDLAPSFIEQLAVDGSWTANLFDAATKEEFDEHQAANRVIEQKDFMRDHLQEFGHVVLPPPEGHIVGTEGGTAGAINEARTSVMVDPGRKAPIVLSGEGAEVPATEETAETPATGEEAGTPATGEEADVEDAATEDEDE